MAQLSYHRKLTPLRTGLRNKGVSKETHMPDIKLYGYATSPYVHKVGCFLYYKQLEFEHVPISPLEAAKALEFVGGTQVPVLVIDGEARRESSELAFWLDERFPERPLCPAEHRDKILTHYGAGVEVTHERGLAETNTHIQRLVQVHSLGWYHRLALRCPGNTVR